MTTVGVAGSAAASGSGVERTPLAVDVFGARIEAARYRDTATRSAGLAGSTLAGLVGGAVIGGGGAPISGVPGGRGVLAGILLGRIGWAWATDEDEPPESLGTWNDRAANPCRNQEDCRNAVAGSDEECGTGGWERVVTLTEAELAALGLGETGFGRVFGATSESRIAVPDPIGGTAEEDEFIRAAWSILQDNTDLLEWAICRVLGVDIDPDHVARLMDYVAEPPSIILLPVDSGKGMGAIEGTNVVWIFAGAYRWLQWMGMWTTGDLSEKLCALLNCTDVFAHELMHLSGFRFDDLESSLCYEPSLVAAAFLYALAVRYPQAGESDCCGNLTNTLSDLPDDEYAAAIGRWGAPAGVPVEPRAIEDTPLLIGCKGGQIIYADDRLRDNCDYAPYERPSVDITPVLDFLKRVGSGIARVAAWVADLADRVWEWTKDTARAFGGWVKDTVHDIGGWVKGTVDDATLGTRGGGGGFSRPPECDLCPWWCVGDRLKHHITEEERLRCIDRMKMAMTDKDEDDIVDVGAPSAAEVLGPDEAPGEGG